MRIKSNEFAVKVDYREETAEVSKILEEVYRINIVRENLKVGDYIIDDEIVIERKTCVDFAQSIVDGRLFRQLKKMKQTFDFTFLIIEGKNIFTTTVNVHPHAIKGTLVNLALIWRVQVLFAKDNSETAFLLWLIGNQNLSLHSGLFNRPGRPPKRFYKRQLYILQGLPQVGPKLAIQLLNYFGNIETVFTASTKELMKISGLGQVKAQGIKEIVTRQAKGN